MYLVARVTACEQQIGAMMIGTTPHAGDLSELRAFGRAADLHRLHRVGVGGRIVPDGSVSPRAVRGKEMTSYEHERAGAEEAGSEAGQGPRQGPPSAGGGAAAHPLQSGLADAVRLEEVLDYYPGWTCESTSSGTSLFRLPVHPFGTLPYHGILLIEIPNEMPEWVGGLVSHRASAPHLRAWSSWHFGVRVRAHHEYPDESMCVHMAGEWRLGRDRLLIYAAFCVLWMAKALHLQLLGRWPGVQHYPAHVRVKRAAYEEFCGCGAKAIYNDCHRAEDETRSPYSRFAELVSSERQYLEEIRARGWRTSGPWKT